MISRILYIYRNNGPKGTVLYLKTCGVLLQQSLGDHKLVDSGLVSKVRPSRNNKGLPRIIPAVLRRAIRHDHFNTIKWVLTIINIFRDIDYVGAPKLGTITQPNTGDMAVYPVLLEYIPIFFQALKVTPSFVNKRLESAAKLFII
jgi:hypothetical protein